MKRHLTKEEVASVINGKGAAEGVPMFLCNWWGNGTQEKYGDALKALEAEFPEDIFLGEIVQPGTVTSTNANPRYRWGFKEDYSTAAVHSIGKDVELLDDWDDFDEFLADFPDPNEPGILDDVIKALPQAGDRYKIGMFWRVFHEYFWSIRGMENLMLDYYDEMEKLKLLGKSVLAFHKVTVDRFAELGFDGIFTSDDLGHQTGPMMSPAVFEELYFPLYKELIEYAHSKGLHVWLHSCGDNTLLLDYLVAAGLDVLHPLQKGCMDEHTIAEKYAGKITFLYGVDVQHLLPEGTPEQVKEEIRSMKKLFGRPEGGLMFAASNGIMPDVPLDNIRAMFEEVCAERTEA